MSGSGAHHTAAAAAWLVGCLTSVWVGPGKTSRSVEKKERKKERSKGGAEISRVLRGIQNLSLSPPPHPVGCLEEKNAAAAPPRRPPPWPPGLKSRGRRASLQQGDLHPGGAVQHGRPRRRGGQPLGRRRPLGLRPLPRRAPPLPRPPLGAGARAAAPGHRRRQPRRRGRPRHGLRQRAAPLRPRGGARPGTRALRRRRHADGRVGQGHRPLRRDAAPGAGGPRDRRPHRGAALVPGGERHRQVVRRHRVRPQDGDARPRPPSRSRHPAPPRHPGWTSLRPWTLHSSRKGSAERDQTPQRQIRRCNGLATARRPSAS